MAKQDNGPVYAAAAVACVLIVTLGVLFSGVLKGGTGTQVGPLSSVMVSASGTAKGVPSMGQVGVYINATGGTSMAATLNLSSRIDAFNKTAYSYVAGNTSLISTGYYNVGQAYSNKTNATPVYEAEESLTVTLPKISQVNGFLLNITGVPGLQVQSVSGTLSPSQVTELRQQALSAAIANATAQAKSIIGNATITNSTVEISSYSTVPYPVYAEGAVSSGGPMVPTGRLYYNGTSTVYENVQVWFYYKK
jgi:uncharacterized protein YggE